MGQKSGKDFKIYKFMINKIKQFINNFSVKQFWIGVGLLIVLRILMVLFLMFEVPYVDFHFDTFAFGGGLGYGDETDYFSLAKQITEFDLKEGSDRLPVGVPIYLAPFVYFFNAETVYDISMPTFIFSAFIFYSISIVLVSLTGRLFFKSNIMGLVLAVIYIFFPWIFYFLNMGPYVKNYGTFVNLMWLNNGMMTDVPSALLLYFVFYFLLKNLENRNFKNYILIGLFFGLACLVRDTNLIFFPVVFLMSFAKNNFKNLFVMLSIIFVICSVQLVYNYLARGSFFDNGGGMTMIDGMTLDDYHLYKMGTIAKSGLSPQNYLYFLTVLDKYFPFLIFLLFGGISVIVFSFYYIYKNLDKRFFYLMLFWVLPFIALFASYNTGARAIRYWLPIIPQMIMLGFCGLGILFYFLKYTKANRN